MEYSALTVFNKRTTVWKARSQASASRLGWMLYFCVTLAIGSWLTPQAKADLLAQYPLADFTLSNSPPSLFATDSVMMVGSSIVLTGDSEGNGESATTDLVTTATQAGLIQFDWSFSAPFDSVLMDRNGGYLLNGVFVQLAADDGESGIAQFNVNTGDTFGFRVGTAINFGEPPVLTISSAVPEPRTGLVLLIAIAGMLSGRLLRRFRSSGTEGGA